MKYSKLYICFLVLLLSKAALASHISGGELFYEYLGTGSATNTDVYRLTVRLFRECNSTGQDLNYESVNIGVFSTAGNNLITTVHLDRLWLNDPPVLQNTPGAIPCLTGDGSLCYQIGLFNATVELPRTAKGYTLSWVRCCRQQVINIQNTPYPDQARGATFITHIPGTSELPTGFNSSPQFVVKDTALVCANKFFTLDFSAFDPDNDSLAYNFCEAYIGATPPDPDPLPTDTLSLIPLPYLSPYSGASPLGSDVTINHKTGIISGKAPATPGKYVIMVCVEEYRNGRLINIHHKDFILKIANCDFASAELHPSYLTCNGFGLQFQNESTSASIYSYYWDFGVPGLTNDTSAQAQPFYNFPDSGTYKVKLVVNRGGSCGDSATTLAKIYPGFKANFGYALKCLPDFTSFFDSSTTRYGKVDTWLWNFGDGNTISNNQNPTYQYATAGAKSVTLTVTNTKGCRDSLTTSINVRHIPLITLYPKDTAICLQDSLLLKVSTNVPSTFTWQPNTAITSINSASPTVFPQSSTSYIVAADDRLGCINTDTVSVTVNALPTVKTMADVTICSGNTVQLITSGTGSTYQWLPATGISNPAQISPVANPGVTTQYVVTALTAAGCQAKDTVNVNVNISPTVKVSKDTLLCVGGSYRLNAVPSVTVTYAWSPAAGLDDPLVSGPVASPVKTTTYTVLVTDSNNCTATAPLTINVIPAPVFTIAPAYKNICNGDSLLITATGGDVYNWAPNTSITNDTAAVTKVYPAQTTSYSVVITNNTCHVADTLQAAVKVSQHFTLTATKLNDVDCFISQAKLQATGGTHYMWQPAATLNNAGIANPVASPVETTTYYVTASNGTACVERDSIQVKIITANATNGYYLASAFTPNGDGQNDCFRIKDWGGIKTIQFSVYNRWGERIFYSTSPTGCWDGTYNGVPQASGTYVYQVAANTICGPVYRKGTIVLIR